MQKLSNGTKWLGIIIILIQLFDAIIHIATDQLEPIRVISNVVVIAWVVAILAGWLGERLRQISFGAIGAYLALNLIFLAQYGLTNPEQDGALRTMLFLLVGLTVVLSMLLIFRLLKGDSLTND